jgi:sulfite reductase (NADPH) flavoprotein alpha-component
MNFPLIPDSAPFSSEQRAWLNGFFAGMLGAGPDGSSPGQFATATATATLAPPAEEEDHPWHDPALPLDERLQLAEGKPLAGRLMAAMAQLDCGACGYICQSYSAAIASGEEADLTRCTPGGSDTAKALKRLLSIEPAGQNGHAASPVSANGHASPKSAGSPLGAAELPGYSRKSPFTARIHSVTRLTQLESPKDTRHVAIDLLDSGLVYEPGDALGVCPVNCPDLVRGIIQQLGVTGDEPIDGGDAPPKPLREALAVDWSLNRCSTKLLELFASSAVDPTERAQLSELAATDGGPLAGADLCEMLERFPSARPPLAELSAALPRLQPRLYSISSSLRRHPGQVHLTVGVVRFESAGRWRNGVASHFLGVRSNSGDPVRVFIHRSPKFRLPADSSTPIIMVGPGTGIAPFIGFLQEREAIGASGKNWLFFGNQNFHLDYLYRDEIDRWTNQGLLHRLDVAFSRDGTSKVYVQDRMREQGAALWAWLEDGASFYICGDAKRMAKDVDAALTQIVAENGGRSSEAAREYVKKLAKDGRYQRDVY